MGADLTRWYRWGALAASAGGAAVSAYLTIEHYTTPALLACPEGTVVNCQKVTTSAQSVVLGVPVALAGLLFFLAMVALTLPPLWRARPTYVRSLRVGAAAAGVAFVLYLVYAELFLVNAICLWCTVAHVAALALLAIVGFATAEAPADAPARSH